MNQEPGSDDEIVQFARDKGADFKIFDKVDCGMSDAAHPLFPFLCEAVPDTGLLTPLLGNGIKWNFAKFLCDADGIPRKRYGTTEDPLSFEDDIVAMLQQGHQAATEGDKVGRGMKQVV